MIKKIGLWLDKKSDEVSTWGGLGLLAVALNSIFDVNELEPIGQAVAQNAEQFAAGNWVNGLMGVAGTYLVWRDQKR